jgi:hypothetical protein
VRPREQSASSSPEERDRRHSAKHWDQGEVLYGMMNKISQTTALHLTAINTTTALPAVR